MKKKLLLIFFLVFFFSASNVFSDQHHSVTDIKIDKNAEQVIQNLVKALKMEKEEESIKALLPLVHSSLITTDGKTLVSGTLQFGFKKARKQIELYKDPVKIERVFQYDQTSIDLGTQKEAGTLYDYFLEKKDGTSAPVKVFKYDSDKKIVVTYFGSL